MQFQGLTWKYYVLFNLSHSSAFCPEEKQIWIFELVNWAFMCLCIEFKFTEHKRSHSCNAIQVPIYLFVNYSHYSWTNLSPFDLFSSPSSPGITTLCSVYRIINSESFTWVLLTTLQLSLSFECHQDTVCISTSFCFMA